MKTYQDMKRALKEDPENGLYSFILESVRDYKRSDAYKTALEAIDYWRNQNPTITKYQKLLYTVSGGTAPDNYSANYKLATNVYFRFITQTVQYLLGKGVSFDSPDTKKRLGGRAFDKALQTALTAALNGGMAYGLWNSDRLEVFGAEEFVPLYDEESGSLMAGIRFWQLERDRPLRLSLFEEDGCTELIMKDSDELPAVLRKKQPYRKTTAYLPSGEELLRIDENYSRLPVIILRSPRKQSSIIGFKKLIDCHDLIASGYANDIDDASLIYWTISNAGGMDEIDLAKFVKQLRTVRAAVVEDDGARAEAHSVSLPYESREAILNRLESDMYRDFMVLNPDTIHGGTSTATAIKAAYEPMNLYSNLLEASVSEFISELLELLDISDSPSFTRTTIVNELEIANTKKARVETALLLKEVLGEQKVRELIEEIVGQGI